ERLLALFALSFLAEVDRTPLGTTADGVDGGEGEGMAGKARADGGQGRRRGPLAARGLPDPSTLFGDGSTVFPVPEWWTRGGRRQGGHPREWCPARSLGCVTARFRSWWGSEPWTARTPHRR